ARPAALLDRLGPCCTDQHVRPINLVEGTVPRPRVRDLLHYAADAHGEGFALDAGDSVYAGHREQIGDVFGVVDLIEELLLVRIHIHTRNEEGFRGDGHAFLLSVYTAVGTADVCHVALISCCSRGALYPSTGSHPSLFSP